MEQTTVIAPPAGAEKIEDVRVSAFRVPTDGPESDGTFAWDATTMVLVEIRSGERTGIGYTYADAAAARLVQDTLAPLITGKDPLDIPDCWKVLVAAVRNNGDTGLSRMAIAAVDNALWDLKARLLGLPLARLLGMAQGSVPAYASGGFTSYSLDRLQGQLGGWAREGFTMVKMKIGTRPSEDPKRMGAAREAIGRDAELFVDANEAFACGEAARIAREFPRLNVTWYEQPIAHQDLDGMNYLRHRVPPGVELASGEYIFEPSQAHHMIDAGAVDVLQADATRCGITGFLKVAAFCEVHRLPLSAHGAPSLHLHLCCSSPIVRHMEYFYDHVRVEHMFFNGAATARKGRIEPNLAEPGMGLTLDRDIAQKYEIRL